MKKTGNSNRKMKAEIKIMLLIIYYTLAGFMGLMSSTIYVYLNISDDVQQMFFCESTGGQECELNFNTIHSIRVSRVKNVVLGLVPVVALLFTFDPKACRKIKK